MLPKEQYPTLIKSAEGHELYEIRGIDPDAYDAVVTDVSWGYRYNAPVASYSLNTFDQDFGYIYNEILVKAYDLDEYAPEACSVSSTKGLRFGTSAQLVQTLSLVDGQRGDNEYEAAADLERQISIAEQTVRNHRAFLFRLIPDDVDESIDWYLLEMPMNLGSKSVCMEGRSASIASWKMLCQQKPHHRSQSQGIDSQSSVHYYQHVAGEDQVVFIDAGTTNFEFARYLRNMPLTLITNDLLIVLKLSSLEGHLHVTGGKLANNVNRYLVGADAIEMISCHVLSMCFIEANSISAQNGFMTHTDEDAQVKRAVLRGQESASIWLTIRSSIGLPS